MPFLDEYLLSVRRQSREQFIAKEARFVLLCSRETTDQNKEWSFRTDSISRSRIALASLVTTEGVSVEPDIFKYEVYPVAKTQRNPWRDRVSIGRARNNDIVLSDPSVSKLHAHVIVAANGDMSICDAGSRIGTGVNYKPLKNGQSVSLVIGDTITIGRVDAMLLDGGGLYDFVAEKLKDGPAPPRG